MKTGNDENNGLDKIDLAIVEILGKEARTPYLEIARRLQISSATVHDRVAKLKNRGIIEGFHARVNVRNLGYEITALVGLRTELAEKIYRTIDELKIIPEIEEIHVVTGDYDLMLKVRAKNPEHLQELLLERIDRVYGFHRSITMMILSSPVEKVSIDLNGE